MGENIETGKKVRDSGIETLRLLALLGVIMIHFSDKALPILTQTNNDNLFILLFWRTLSSNAVNIFLIISGYFMCTSNKRTLGKPFSLILQVCVYNELAYLVEACLGIHPFALRHIVSSLIPDSYYTTLFVVVYFISPYLNRLFSTFKSVELKKFVFISFVLFSILSLPSLLLCELTNQQWMGLNTIGAWGSQQGFNIVNFLLCYIVGAYLRLGQIPQWLSCRRNQLLLLSIVILLLFGWAIVNQYYLYKQGMRSAWVYDNPLVIVYGALLFLIFKNIHFSSRIINSLSTSVYATFLIHCNVIAFIPFADICNQPWYMFVVYFVAFSIIMIIFSWSIYKVYTILTNKMLCKLDMIQVGKDNTI